METYFGCFKNVQDALILLEACRMGTLKRIHRRLADNERSTIRSGSVFIWEEVEAGGMRRWTDGIRWGPSRVVNVHFLKYHELDSKRKIKISSSPQLEIKRKRSYSQFDNDDSDDNNNNGTRSCSDIYENIKENGLIKFAYSVTSSLNEKLHLISYFSLKDIHNNLLPRPSNDPNLSKVRDMMNLAKLNFQNSPHPPITYYNIHGEPLTYPSNFPSSSTIQDSNSTTSKVQAKPSTAFTNYSPSPAFTNYSYVPQPSSYSFTNYSYPYSYPYYSYPPHPYHYSFPPTPNPTPSPTPSPLLSFSNTPSPLLSFSNTPRTVQDIPCTKLRNSEDERQLKLLSSFSLIP